MILDEENLPLCRSFAVSHIDLLSSRLIVLNFEHLMSVLNRGDLAATTVYPFVPKLGATHLNSAFFKKCTYFAP